MTLKPKWPKKRANFVKTVAKSTPRSEDLRVEIAGAGLLGRLLGWHYTQQGAQVQLFERARADSPRSAAHVAAAILAAPSERTESDALILSLAKKSLKLWPEWLNELEVPYALEGSIITAHPNDTALLTQFVKVMNRRAVPGVRVLGQKELNSLEPDLASHFQSGVFLEGEGWLDNRALLQSLEQVCGTISYETPVETKDLGGDLVIDCRGAGSDDPDIRGVRGEILRLYAPEVNLKRPIRLLHPKYPLYVAPRPNHQYVLGATQIESEYEGKVTVRSALELLSTAYVISAGFEEAEISELSSGLRPAYPDNNPRVYWDDHILRVNGLYRCGFAIAPAIVQRATAMVEQRCAS
ncbi:MAG: FAD-dependent oxidoreductase [Gammaproteobacteria bacterium]|nr:FAD-dependent oxidoreductase [Gammaproteobacteria bacterium]MYC24370.1 FAD-dependent oxidoreductase [Gammaproteobacteria bacterium]